MIFSKIDIVMRFIHYQHKFSKLINIYSDILKIIGIFAN